MKVTLTTKQVIDMTSARLAKIRETRKTLWRSAIIQEIARRERRRRYFWWLKPHTEESAKAAIEARGWRSSPDTYGWHTESICKRAGIMAMKGTVTLDGDEFERIRG